MAGLKGVAGYYNVSKEKARELITPHSSTNGFYLLRPSGDKQGAILCTICVTHDSKVLNYRVSVDRRNKTYFINQSVQFNTMKDLISHYSKNNLNDASGTRLITPVGGTAPAENGLEDCYVVMEKTETQSAAPLPQPKSVARKFKNRPLPSAPGPSPSFQPTPVPTPAPKKPRPSAKNHTPTHKSHAPQSQEVPGLHRNLIKPLLKTAMQPYLGQDGWFILRPSSTDNQLTLTVSHGGKILNFKLSEVGGQYHIAQKNKFPTVQGLIAHYYTNPIRSKQRADQTILLVRPIPVDPQLEARAKEMAAAQPDTVQQTTQGVTLPDALPHPWQEVYNEQYKRNFYYNPETGDRTWERPQPAPPTKPHPQQPQILEQTKRIQQRPLPSPPGREAVEPEPSCPSPSILKKRQTMPIGSTRPPSAKKMGMPLPAVLETQTTEQSNMVNGFHSSTLGRRGGAMADRPPAVLPGQAAEPPQPTPAAHSGEPPALPPTNRSRRHASVCAATRGRPPLPMTPGEEQNQPPPVLRSSSQRELPPLPAKEEEKRQHVLSPLPAKEELPALPPHRPSPAPSPKHIPQQQPPVEGSRKPRRKVIEYEDVPVFKPKKKTAPPPLPDKEEEPPQAPPTRERGPPPPLPEKESRPSQPMPAESVRAPPPLPEKETPPTPVVSSPPVTPVRTPPNAMSTAPAPPPLPTVGGPPPPGIPPPPSPMTPRSRDTRSHSEATASSDSGNNRPFNANDLLASAQRLRRVEVTQEQKKNVVPEEGGGLEGTLNRAITNKFKNVQYSDSEEEFDDVDEEEWD